MTALSNPWRNKVAEVFGRLCSKGNAIKTVLDCGCSDGEVAIELGRRWNGIRFTGIDIRSDELAVAEQRRKSLNLSNVQFINDYFLKRRDCETYDVVTFSEVYEHLIAENQIFSLRLIGTMLRPGGHIIVTTPNGQFPFSKLERHKTFLSRYPDGFFADLSQTMHWLEPTLLELVRVMRALGFDVIEMGYFNLPLVHRNQGVSALARGIVEPVLNCGLPRTISRQLFKNQFILAQKNPQSPLLRDAEIFKQNSISRNSGPIGVSR